MRLVEEKSPEKLAGSFDRIYAFYMFADNIRSPTSCTDFSIHSRLDTNHETWMIGYNVVKHLFCLSCRSGPPDSIVYDLHTTLL